MRPFFFCFFPSLLFIFSLILFFELRDLCICTILGRVKFENIQKFENEKGAG